jgi:tRNA (guanine37-N1)-methyltransferase
VNISVITLFPEMFEAISQYGISGRSIRDKRLSLTLINPRNFTKDKHHTVDDRPYGGGPGMVMMVEPLRKAMRDAEKALPGAHRICLSPQGRRLDQNGLKELSQYESIVMVAGRYEGIDERFLANDIDEEWSVGDYVLSGGELAAMVLIDGIIRLLPGALGHEDSASQDSHFAGLLDHPHYTRPEDEEVPPVLLGGNHAEIERWRLKQSLGKTWLKRPDLLDDRVLTDREQDLLNEFIRERTSP